jgi:hypothetical protein
MHAIKKTKYRLGSWSRSGSGSRAWSGTWSRSGSGSRAWSRSGSESRPGSRPGFK